MPRPEIVGRILEHLLRGLAAGTWPVGQRVPSTRDLAKQLHVSQDTVVKAVQQAGDHGLLEVLPRRPVVVCPDAASRAREILRERRRRAAGSRVAVLVRENVKLAHPFFSSFLSLARRLAAERAIELQLVHWPQRSQIRFASSLPAAGYRAAMCLALQPNYWAGVEWMHEHGFPVLAINRDLPAMDVSTVRGDAFRAGHQVARHLIDLGHRNLCLVAHFLAGAAGSRQDEVAGWTTALDEAGLINTCPLPLYVQWSVSPLRDNPHTFDNLFSRNDRPTAVVFTSPPWAKLLLSDPRFARFRVPEDVSIAVLNTGDPPLEIAGLPPLTQARLDLHRMVECVVEVLAEMVAGDMTPRRLLLPMDLVLTESVGPPPRAGD